MLRKTQRQIDAPHGRQRPDETAAVLFIGMYGIKHARRHTPWDHFQSRCFSNQGEREQKSGRMHGSAFAVSPFFEKISLENRQRGRVILRLACCLALSTWSIRRRDSLALLESFLRTLCRPFPEAFATSTAAAAVCSTRTSCFASSRQPRAVGSIRRCLALVEERPA